MAESGQQQPALPRVLRPDSSALFLSETSDLRRLPRAPGRRRSAAFMDRFEDRALFYDCFRHADGDRVLLIGPPPLNLEPHYQRAEFHVPGNDRRLDVQFHRWRSTLVTSLSGVPADACEIRVQMAGVDAVLPIQPNLSEELAGRRVMFTMNKDNAPDWIEEWARYHALMHGVDGIVLFDNGSTLYGLDELAERLIRIPQLRSIVLCDWPHRFGAHDNKVLMHRFWAHFLQNSAMTTVIRRFGASAAALLNCDVDELVEPFAGGTIFDTVAASPDGLVCIDGTWVSSARAQGDAGPGGHFDFQHLLRDPLRLASPGKWVLDAKRDWVADLDVMASWHRVRNVPSRIEKNQPHTRFWHFAGINSNWKSSRRRLVTPHPLWHRKDEKLMAARSSYFAKVGKGQA